MSNESVGEWSEWSECSATCGNGTQTRSKMCSVKNETETQSQPCPNLPPCESEYHQPNFPLSVHTKTSFFFNLACKCDEQGSLTELCDDDGKCDCKPNIVGEKCDACLDQFYSFPQCKGMCISYF